MKKQPFHEEAQDAMSDSSVFCGSSGPRRQNRGREYVGAERKGKILEYEPPLFGFSAATQTKVNRQTQQNDCLPFKCPIQFQPYQ